MKKFLACLLSLVLVCGLSACSGVGNGGGKKNGNVTVVRVQNYNGGVGSEWLADLEKRFEASYAEKSYAEGKMGVDIDVRNTESVDSNTLNTSGYNIYIAERYYDITAMAQEGSLLNLNSLITEEVNGVSLENKIYDGVKDILKGIDGNYYALPHYEFYPGLSYDADAFLKKGLYFAADASNGNLYNSKYGSAYFIAPNNKNAKKSCGSDGIYGTIDDGLPSSLQELIILCAKMKQNMDPIMLSGMYRQYSNYMMNGLWAALAGTSMDTVYTFTGEAEVITGWTDENLFQGIDYIKKPVTEKVTISEETGWQASNMAAKYYALAFMEIAEREGWFSSASMSSSVSHTDAQSRFVFGDTEGSTPSGMLCEGSYWHNESELAGVFEDYALFDDKERNVAFMPLPTTLNTTVTEGNGGGKYTLLDQANAFVFVNAYSTTSQEVLDACMDFLKFMYSDAELRAFTVSTGCARPLDYTLTEGDKANMSLFYRSIWDMRESGHVTYFSGSTGVFRKHHETFKLHISGVPNGVDYNGTHYSNYLSAFRGKSVSSKEAFNMGAYTAQSWLAMME